MVAGAGDAAAAVTGSTKAPSGRVASARGKRAAPAPRPPGSSATATAGKGKGILVGGDDVGAEDGHMVAVGKGGRLVRLSTCDFHTPTKQPQSSVFAATAVAAEPGDEAGAGAAGPGAGAGAAVQRAGTEGGAARECQCCASCGANGGGAAGTRGEGAGERRRGGQPLGEAWDERKEGEKEVGAQR